MMPEASNPAFPGERYGSVNGGTILGLIDNVGGMAAARHARGPTVTASIDQMVFETPVHIGELLVVKACVNYVGKTSMEVGVRVEAEDTFTGVRRHTGSSYLTFVGIGLDKRTRILPPLKPETEEEKRRYSDAEKRRKLRLQAMK